MKPLTPNFSRSIVKGMKKKTNTVTKSDIKMLAQKIDRNQKALDQIDDVARKIDDVSAKIDRNQKALDQIDDVARILRDNEQNLKDLGGLKDRLDLLDVIEKHLHLPVAN